MAPRRPGTGRKLATRRFREATPLAQAAAQRAWNAERVARLLAAGRSGFDFFTAGSSGRSPEELLELASRAPFRARLLVDVRANPRSLHTPEWNDRRLERTLIASGWEYLPRPDLGVPAEMRRKLHGGEIGYDRFFAWYDRQVATPERLDSIEPLIARRPVLLCTELAPTFCHRHRLARALEARGERVSFDL